jgi:hypothetical protein
MNITVNQLRDYYKHFSGEYYSMVTNYRKHLYLSRFEEKYKTIRSRLRDYMYGIISQVDSTIQIAFNSTMIELILDRSNTIMLHDMKDHTFSGEEMDIFNASFRVEQRLDMRFEDIITNLNTLTEMFEATGDHITDMLCIHWRTAVQEVFNQYI